MTWCVLKSDIIEIVFNNIVDFVDDKIILIIFDCSARAQTVSVDDNFSEFSFYSII